jgi:hypothetical protein
MVKFENILLCEGFSITFLVMAFALKRAQILAAIVAVIAGLASGVASIWETSTASAQPTAIKTASFVSHSTTYYASPMVVEWNERLYKIGFPTTMICLGIMGATWIADWALRRSARRVI